MINRPIVFVIGSLESGGAERFLFWLVERLVQQWNRDVYVFSIRGGLLHQRFISTGAKICVSNTSGHSKLLAVVRLGISLGQHLDNYSASIVCSFLPASNLLTEIVRLCGKNKSFKHFIFRRSRNYWRSRKWQVLEKFIFDLKHCEFVGNSDTVVSDIESDHRGHNIMISKLINPVPNFYFEEGVQINRKNWIVCVANLIWYKNHIGLVEVFSKALELGLSSDYRLILIGEDRGEGENIKHVANCLNVRDKVIFTGHCEDVVGYLARAKFFMLLSHEEGSSNALGQAIASGCLPLVSDVGSSREIVINGKTGVVSNSKETLASKLVDLSVNPTVRDQMITRGRFRLRSQYSESACLTRFLRLMEV